MLKRTLTPLAAVLGLLCAANAQAENLIDIYRAALQNDPTYLAAEANNRATAEGVAQARARLLPSITGSTGLTINDSLSKGDTQDLGVRLSQSVYNHSNWVALSQAQKRTEASALKTQGDLQALAVRVAEAYFNVLAAQDGIELSQAEQKAIGQQLEQTKQRFNVGLIAITDVHEAQARFDQSQASSLQAQNALDNANEALRVITGAYYQTLSRLKADLPLASPEPANPDDWVKAATETNLSLLSQKLTTEVARQDIHAAQSGHLPTASLSAFKNLGGSQRVGTINLPPDGSTPRVSAGNDYEYQIGLSVSIPIFSGGATKSQTNQAEHRFAAATQDLEAVYRRVIRDTRSAYLGVNANLATVKALQQAEISAQSALEATQAGFEVGTRTIVDVLQATSNLYSAKRNLWRARYDYVLNILRLKSAAGTLTEDDVARVNSWLN